MDIMKESTALVFFDIDGTLIDERHKVPTSATEAIRCLRQNGHLAFLNTGRSRACIHPHILEVGFDGIVAACGAYVEVGGQIILNQLIAPDIVAELLPQVRACGLDSLLEGPECIYFEHWNQQGGMKRYEEIYSDLPEALRLWKELPLELIRMNKMCFSRRPDSRDEPVLAYMRQHFLVVDHAPDILVEVLQKGCTKATGMQLVMDCLNLPAARTFAFGDSLNDLDMLQFAETGIAMGGSRNRVLLASDHVTRSASEHGIAEALRHFGLID